MTPAANWLDTLPRHRLMAEYSLWSADLLNIGAEIDRVDPYVDLYHIDVADGHFSPALLYFPDLVAACRKRTARPFHVHLMATDDILLNQIDQFAEAGADLISVHAENGDPEAALARIESHGVKAGIVLQLFTPVSEAAQWLDRIAMLTLLGTRIGVKGQGLDPEAEPRLAEARALIAGRNVVLAADGAIRDHTVPGLAAHGAETIVMGSLAFNAPDLAARMAWVHGQKIGG
ncbi:ribulose-5-phosphate 3-epimerase [Celeribacter baekdonensis]|uniref:Ribulose-5-phosphate 3-epimerase n=1 Tax=Celeribacter baekdonensis TaxID=875171 RepID=A0A1G7QWJ5_9RHOB|nr:ribulose-phosphate 3-epimerase [Celeribacter baekdonensis]SDG02259.1 ribulose-5-phosphate 3-epimerase [Celeribacter baekdonensis]